MHGVLEKDRTDNLSGLKTFKAELISRILDGNWFVDPTHPDALLIVSDLEGVPFGLGFNLFRDIQHLQQTRLSRDVEEREKYLIGISQFDILFGCHEDPYDIRIHEVYFGNKYAGTGAKFLTAVLNTALDLGGTRIFVAPAFDGSSYWTRRGALLQRWPLCSDGQCALKNRITQILERRDCVYPCTKRQDSWAQEDLDTLRRALETRDYKMLNALVVRDDLLVWRPPSSWIDKNQEPVCRFLLQDLTLGMGVFDLTHPLTQQCLRARLGFDVVQERARRARAPMFPPTMPQYVRRSVGANSPRAFGPTR